MLRKGFLQTISDWVCGSLETHEEAFENATIEFSLGELLPKVTDQEKLMGLFSEWLVFDRKSATFGGKTGLEYFVRENPLHLSVGELSAYNDLRTFVVGLFEVISVYKGEHITLKDEHGSTFEVFDVSLSLSLAGGEILWGRIACVEGTYQVVGSTGFALPTGLGATIPKLMKVFHTQQINARVAAHVFSEFSKNSLTHRDGDAEINDPKPMPEAEAARIFDTVLAQCKMEHMLSSTTIKMWANNERRFSLGFPIKAMFFLLPDDLTDQQRNEVLNSVQLYLHNCPRRSLKGKTPLTVSDARAPSERVFETDVFGHDDYRPDYEKAQKLMRLGDYEGSYAAYESLIRRLLNERVPAFPAFRFFANAALACFLNPDQKNDMLGCELIRAALRMNPQYDFGIEQREKFVDPYEDFFDVPKGNVKLVKTLHGFFQKRGIRQYRRSAFAKYEDFLKKCEVSLEYETHTHTTLFKIPVDDDEELEKIGRNDPCPCLSGKKYKKCCGV